MINKIFTIDIIAVDGVFGGGWSDVDDVWGRHGLGLDTRADARREHRYTVTALDLVWVETLCCVGDCEKHAHSH